MIRARTLAILLSFALTAWPAFGANTCTVAGTNLQFGSFSGIAISVTGTLTVKCTSGLVYNIGIDAGTGTSATVTTRAMTGPSSAQLGYGLYQDAAHTINWGTTVGIDTEPGTGTGKNQSISVFALLPTNEYAPAGNFTDATLNVSVSGSGFTTATNHFNVKASVTKACNIGASSLSFGVYSNALINATSTISVQCTNKTTYNVGLDAGSASGATVTTRKMTGPATFSLSYSLFSNSGRTTNWGNTVGTDTVAGTGTGLVQSLTVFGQVPAAQTLRAPGNYSDTITATITY